MLRAGVLHATFESWGGAEWFIHQTSAGLPVATHRWSDPPGGGARPASVLEHRCGAARSGPADWARAGRLIAPWSAGLDVLVAHNWPAILWAEEAGRSGAPRPVVLYCHEPPAALYDEAAPEEPSPARSPGEMLADASFYGAGLPRHALQSLLWRLSPPAREELRRRDADAVRSAAVVLANSRFTGDRVRAIYGRDARVVYPVPADLGAFAAGTAAPREPTVLWVGRMTAAKRPLLMLEAWERARLLAPGLASWRLILVGDGPLFPAVTERIRSGPGGQAVSLRRGVSRAELAGLYRSASVTVHLGVREPFGLVALESAAAGTPVIAEADGGAPEIIRDGETGWLLRNLDAAALAARLAELPAQSDRLVRMGAAAAEDAAARFRFEQTAAALGAAVEEAHATGVSKSPSK